MALSVTYTFTNATTASATEVNTNFTDILNILGDGTKSLSISALTCAGAATLNGNVTLGNASGDDITITGSIAASIPLKADGTLDIGSSTLGLSVCYFGDAGGNTVGIQAPAIAANYTMDLPGFTTVLPAADGAALDWMVTDASGNFSFTGGSVTVKTSAYTVTTADKIVSGDASGGAFSLTLYAVSGNAGRTVKIINIGASGTVTIDGNGGETIDGATTIALPQTYDSIEIVCNGTSWFSVSRNIPVYARYETNAGQSITQNSLTIVDFEDVTFDSHSAVTIGAAWKFRAPIAGKYRVSSFITYTGSAGWTLGKIGQLRLLKGGATTIYLEYREVQSSDAGAIFLTLKGTTTIDLAATNYIDIRTYQDTAGAIALEGSAVFNYVDIELIGH